MYFGDASGGELTSSNDLRRCGCGLASMSDDLQLRYGVDFNLPGPVQTVGRAEAYALVYLVDRVSLTLQELPCNIVRVTCDVTLELRVM